MNRSQHSAENHDGRPLPHQNDREKAQPYAKENEDYSGGVVEPPKEQVGKREKRQTPGASSPRPSRPTP
jgi:hypothetical protein